MTDPHSRQIIATQVAGAQAYQSGASGRDNPYLMRKDELLCLAWIRGFNMARTERAREIERVN